MSRTLSSILIKLGASLALSIMLGITAASAATFTVDSHLDTNDATPGDGTCADAGAVCTFRAAIQEANALGGGDTIEFQITTGIYTIEPTNAFPSITEAVVIDARTQAGFVDMPLIEISGESYGTVASPLQFDASGSLYGLAFNRFSNISILQINASGVGVFVNTFGLGLDGETTYGDVSTGIELGGNNSYINNNRFAGLNTGIISYDTSGHTIIGSYFGLDYYGTTGLGIDSTGISLNNVADTIIGGDNPASGNTFGANNIAIGLSGTTNNTTILGNKIGTTPNGLTAIPNSVGIWISSTATETYIGTAVAGGRNLISGNSGNGIQLYGSETYIYNNYIGTDSTGQVALPNGQNGIWISASDVTIGGPAENQRNVISGNNWAGIEFTSAQNGTSGYVIQGNYIGVAADGTTELGNGSQGIVNNGTDIHGVVIGGRAEGEANIIANSGGGGVLITGNSINNRISGNSIYNSFGTYGIDLGNDDFDNNDLLDVDTGSNNKQNHPIIDNAIVIGNDISISGTLNSYADGNFDIEFFWNADPGASNKSEGEIYLGFTQVATDENGDANFSANLTDALQYSEGYLTALAIDENGDTSEFSDYFYFDPPKNYCVSATRVDPIVNCHGNDFAVDLEDINADVDPGDVIYVDAGTYGELGEYVNFAGGVTIQGYSDVDREDVVLNHGLIFDDNLEETNTVGLSTLTMYGEILIGDADIDTTYSVVADNIIQTVSNNGNCVLPSDIDSLTNVNYSNSLLSCSFYADGGDYSITDSIFDNFVSGNESVSIQFHNANSITLTGNQFDYDPSLENSTYFIRLSDTGTLNITDNNFNGLFEIGNPYMVDYVIDSMDFSDNTIELTGISSPLYMFPGVQPQISELVFDDNVMFNPYDVGADHHVIRFYNSTLTSFANNVLPNTLLEPLEYQAVDDEKLIENNILQNVDIDYSAGTVVIRNNHFWTPDGTYNNLVAGEPENEGLAEFEVYNNIFYTSAGSALTVSGYEDYENTASIDNNIFLINGYRDEEGYAYGVDLYSNSEQDINFRNNYLVATNIAGAAAVRCEPISEDEVGFNPLVVEGNFFDAGIAEHPVFQSYNWEFPDNVHCNSEVLDYMMYGNHIRTQATTLDYDISSMFELMYEGDIATINPDSIVLDGAVVVENLFGKYIYIYNDERGAYLPILSNTGNTIYVADLGINFTETFADVTSYWITDFSTSELSPFVDSGSDDTVAATDFNGVVRPENSGYDRGVFESDHENANAPEVSNVTVNASVGPILNYDLADPFLVDYDYVDDDGDNQLVTYVLATFDGLDVTLPLNRESETAFSSSAAPIEINLSEYDGVPGGTTFYVSVMACDIHGACSEPTGYVSITTLDNTEPTPTNLKINNLVSPQNVCTLKPTISWTFSDPDPGATQSSYIAMVYQGAFPNVPANAVWYSNSVASSATSVQVPVNLTYGTSYNFYVGVEDQFDGFGAQTSSFKLASNATCNPPTAPTTGGGGNNGDNGGGDDNSNDDNDGGDENNNEQGEADNGSEDEGDDTTASDVEEVADEVFGPETEVDERELPDEDGYEPPSIDDVDFEDLLDTILDYTGDDDISDNSDESVSDVISAILSLASSRNVSGIGSGDYGFGQKYFTLADGTPLNKSPSFFDTDFDGCSDRVELQLTKSSFIGGNSIFGDCDSAFVWGFENSNEADVILQGGEDYVTVNLSKDGSKNVFKSVSDMVILGGVFSPAPGMKNAKIKFQLYNPANGVTYDMGQTQAQFELLANQQGYKAQFSFANSLSIPDGDYKLQVTAYTSKSAYATTNREISVDSGKPTKTVDVIEFSGHSFDNFVPDSFKPGSKIKGLNLVVEEDGRTYVYGQTDLQSTVIANWNSILLTSVAMADSSSGRFYIEPRQKLEPGNHTLTLYAKNLHDATITSQPVEINFKVLSEQQKLIRKISYAGGTVVALIALILTFTSLRRIRRKATTATTQSDEIAI